MKKIIRLCLCLAMLFIAIGAHAQTAADGIYSKGMALKKQRTKTSLTQAIANFRKAKGLYAPRLERTNATHRLAHATIS